MSAEIRKITTVLSEHFSKEVAEKIRERAVTPIARELYEKLEAVTGFFVTLVRGKIEVITIILEEDKKEDGGWNNSRFCVDWTIAFRIGTSVELSKGYALELQWSHFKKGGNALFPRKLTSEGSFVVGPLVGMVSEKEDLPSNLAMALIWCLQQAVTSLRKKEEEGKKVLVRAELAIKSCFSTLGLEIQGYGFE